MTKKIPQLASKQLEPLLTPLSEIRPHPENYKIHTPEQLQSLRASLKAFGCTQPIKVNLDGVIVAGHGMYQLYIEDGYTDAPVMYEALDKQLSKAYLVADNETARRAETDQDKLSLLLQDAAEIPDFDIEAVGFSEEDIDYLLKIGEPVEVAEDEFNPDGEIETRCKEGDLWQLGRHKLLCADCTDINNVKRLMGGVKADMIFTDPPYNVSFNGRSGKFEVIENDDLSDLDFTTFIEKVLNSVLYLNPSAYYICCNWAFYGLLQLKLKPKACIVWAKNVFGLGNGYRHQHEFILFNGYINPEIKNESDLWEIKKDTNYVHPTQKPIELSARAIENSTSQNNIVVDLFLGSGSTLLACEQLDRICYGTEIDPHYCSVILKRFYDFTGTEPIREDGVLYTELM